MAPIVLQPIETPAPCDVPDGGTGIPLELNEDDLLEPLETPEDGLYLPIVSVSRSTCGAPLDPSEPEPAPEPPPPPPLLSFGKRAYQLTHFMQVPEQGTLYLLYGGVSTASTPLLLSQDIRFTGVSISIDAPDPDNEYELEILVSEGAGYLSVEQVPLLTGTLGSFDVELTATAQRGNGVGMRLVRTSGSTASAFRAIAVSLEMRET